MTDESTQFMQNLGFATFVSGPQSHPTPDTPPT
jgi:hypothetical protein